MHLFEILQVGMGQTPTFPENLSEEGNSFLSNCFVHDPGQFCAKWTVFFFLNSVHSLTRFGLALFHPSQRYKCHICSVSTLYLGSKDRRKREEVGYKDAPHLSKTVRRKAFLQFNLINGRPMWYVICYSSLVLYASLDLSYQSLSMGIFCLQFVLWSW